MNQHSIPGILSRDYALVKMGARDIPDGESLHVHVRFCLADDMTIRGNIWCGGGKERTCSPRPGTLERVAVVIPDNDPLRVH